MNAYPDLPEHLVRSLLIAVPNLRRRDVVDGGDRRNSGVSSKPRRGRLGALLHTHQRCAKSLGCRVVSDTHDRARANRTIVAESHLASRFYELLDLRFVKYLDGRADLRYFPRLHHKPGHDAEVARAAFQSPKELRVGRRIRNNLSAIAENDIIASDAVHGVAKLVDEVVEAAYQREARDTNSLKPATVGIEPIFVERTVYISPHIAWSD